MNHDRKIRIIIFDDSRERRESIELLVSMFDDMEFAGSFETCEGAVRAVEALTPNVILMDIQMPGMTGIEGVRQIKNAHPTAVVLMQTVFEDEQRIFDSIKAGASGYILKSASPDKLVEAIREAADGGAPMTPSVAIKVLNFFQQLNQEPQKPTDYLLTDREKDILSQLVEGKSYKMIAAEYHISYHTVNSHIRRIYEKLHVHSLGEAVSKALKERLV